MAAIARSVGETPYMAKSHRGGACGPEVRSAGRRERTEIRAGAGAACPASTREISRRERDLANGARKAASEGVMRGPQGVAEAIGPALGKRLTNDRGKHVPAAWQCPAPKSSFRSVQRFRRYTGRFGGLSAARLTHFFERPPFPRGVYKVAKLFIIQLQRLETSYNHGDAYIMTNSKRQKKCIGIRDIAALASVSTATVSRVINQPESTSPEIRKKVQAVIREYNYVPNRLAKNLFSKTSNSIALFVYDVGNPFFSTLIKELNKISFDNQFTLLICDTEDNKEKEEKYLRYCQSIRCSGSILTEGVNYNLFTDTNFGQKISCLDRSIGEDYSFITSDNYGGVQRLMDYLYNLNHRKIAFVGPQEKYQSAITRKSSYIDALNARGIPVVEDYIFERGRFSSETGVEALGYFWSLNEPPTAVVCANDQIAQGLIMKAYKLGISVPGNISVAGYDGVDLSYFYPKITTIKQDIHQLAVALFDSVKDKNAPVVHKVVPNIMEIGESCRKISLQDVAAK